MTRSIVSVEVALTGSIGSVEVALTGSIVSVEVAFVDSMATLNACSSIISAIISSIVGSGSVDSVVFSGSDSKGTLTDSAKVSELLTTWTSPKKLLVKSRGSVNGSIVTVESIESDDSSSSA